MHELSLVRALLSQVDAISRQHDQRPVRVVEVELGPLSGVEPLLLSQAFEQLRETTCAASAALEIRTVELTARCSACELEIQLDELDFRCPQCRRGMKVTRGDKLMLLSVTLEDAARDEQLEPTESVT